jgi:hypothetical protein
MEFAGLPWDIERERGSRPFPKTGSALHHLVTAVGVKKALKELLQLRAPLAMEPEVRAGDASRTHPAKMRSGDRLTDCAGGKVKE